MKTNDIKKGMWVLLRNGWHGEMWDNYKGNIRIVDVYGFEHEAGSVYAHDIIGYAFNPITQNHPKDDKNSFNWNFDIEYTPSQLKCRKMVKNMELA